REHLAGTGYGAQDGPGEKGVDRAPPRPASQQHPQRPQHRHRTEEPGQPKRPAGDGMGGDHSPPGVVRHGTSDAARATTASDTTEPTIPSARTVLDEALAAITP